MVSRISNDLRQEIDRMSFDEEIYKFAESRRQSVPVQPGARQDQKVQWKPLGQIPNSKKPIQPAPTRMKEDDLILLQNNCKELHSKHETDEDRGDKTPPGKQNMHLL